MFYIISGKQNFLRWWNVLYPHTVQYDLYQSHNSEALEVWLMQLQNAAQEQRWLVVAILDNADSHFILKYLGSHLDCFQFLPKCKQTKSYQLSRAWEQKRNCFCLFSVLTLEMHAFILMWVPWKVFKKLLCQVCKGTFTLKVFPIWQGDLKCAVNKHLYVSTGCNTSSGALGSIQYPTVGSDLPILWPFI